MTAKQPEDLDEHDPAPKWLLTPEMVHNIAFKKPPLGKRGYDEEEVDAFLDIVELAIAGRSSLTSAEVRNVAFIKPPLGKRGYE